MKKLAIVAGWWLAFIGSGFVVVGLWQALPQLGPGTWKVWSFMIMTAVVVTVLDTAVIAATVATFNTPSGWEDEDD